MRKVGTILATLACLGAIGAAPAAAAPPIKHVFLIVLENKGFSETFGKDSQAPYLAETLRGQGQLIANYYAVAHLSLPNYIAMVSGQAANPITQSDCQFYMDIVPGWTQGDRATAPTFPPPGPAVVAPGFGVFGPGCSSQQALASPVSASSKVTISRPS